MLNCLLILTSQELQPVWTRWHKAAPRLSASRPWGVFQATRTFLLMGLIRSLDCYANVGLTFRMWGSMFTKFNIGDCFGGQIFDLGLELKDYIILAVAVTLVAIVAKLSQKRDLREWLYGKTALSWALSGAILVAILLFGAYSIGYDASQFIYTVY
jgi:hypothetical protein